ARAVSSVTAQTVTDPEIASADSSRAGRPRRSARLPRAPWAAALFDRRRAHTSCRLATSDMPLADRKQYLSTGVVSRPLFGLEVRFGFCRSTLPLLFRFSGQSLASWAK